MDALGENHDQVLNDAKTRIATEIKTIADTELQHTSSGTCTKNPSVILSTCETCQVIKATKAKSHPGFIIAFDNIDIHLERSEMTLSAQNRDIHWGIMKWFKIGSQEIILISTNLRRTLQMSQISHSSLVWMSKTDRGWTMSFWFQGYLWAILSVLHPSEMSVLLTYLINTARNNPSNLLRY